VQEVLYVEAVKKVEDDGSRVRDPERISVSRFLPAQRDRTMSDLCLSKVGFVAMVINCTAEMECKLAGNICCGGSCKEVFGYTRFEFRRTTGCVEGWCPVIPVC
jgi:hypothetical protein